MKMDTTDALRVVQNKSSESEIYRRQIHIWLGVGSAGGAISMASLAANLQDPDYVFRFLQPSFWSFLTGVVAAGASLFFLSLRAEAMAAHYAASHNRDRTNQEIKAIPEVIASPRRLADEANGERDALIEASQREHQRAEREWTLKQRHSVGWGASLTLSALAFILGFAWPLVQISFLGATLSSEAIGSMATVP